MPVYLIQAGANGPVKIGKADYPAARLAEFQCSHYETLTLLRTWPGGRVEEAALHRAFSEYHLRGEWFRFCPAMLDADPAALLSAEPAKGVSGAKLSEPNAPELVALVEAHLAATGTPASTFGVMAVGDPNFVRNIRSGREPRSRVVARVMAFIRQSGADTEPATLPAGARVSIGGAG